MTPDPLVVAMGLSTDLMTGPLHADANANGAASSVIGFICITSNIDFDAEYSLYRSLDLCSLLQNIVALPAHRFALS